ncbi:hypothetical protein D3C76_1531620 [compost metagenome]
MLVEAQAILVKRVAGVGGYQVIGAIRVVDPNLPQIRDVVQDDCFLPRFQIMRELRQPWAAPLQTIKTDDAMIDSAVLCRPQCCIQLLF